MFDELSDKFESAWKNLRGHDKISDTNVQNAIREVRRALIGSRC
jgi:signal recognition particle subunit SRP54